MLLDKNSQPCVVNAVLTGNKPVVDLLLNYGCKFRLSKVMLREINDLSEHNIHVYLNRQSLVKFSIRIKALGLQYFDKGLLTDEECRKQADCVNICLNEVNRMSLDYFTASRRFTYCDVFKLNLGAVANIWAIERVIARLQTKEYQF